MTKAVVHYRPDPDSDYIVHGHTALVQPVDHTSPLVSNRKIVRTSKVVWLYEGGIFETLNSVYKPIGVDDCL